MIAARGEPPKRQRQREPDPRAMRHVSLADEKVEQPSHQRVYLVPSYTTGEPGEAEALELLAHLLGGGQTSLLYRHLVVEQKIAVNAGAYYMGTALDDTRFWLYGTPAPGATLEQLDSAIAGIVADVAKNGVAQDDLARARTRLIADAVYAQDSQVSLAQWYGAALTTGAVVADIAQWPARIDAVSAARIQAACAKWLERKRAVTGFLLPAEREPAA